jgi:hypothetical protein
MFSWFIGTGILSLIVTYLQLTPAHETGIWRRSLHTTGISMDVIWWRAKFSYRIL